MGFFDGPVMSFAEKFCRYLDGRVIELHNQAGTEADPYTKLRCAVVAEALNEVSLALKTVTGL